VPKKKKHKKVGKIFEQLWIQMVNIFSIQRTLR
jgi:hypothetical protein